MIRPYFPDQIVNAAQNLVAAAVPCEARLAFIKNPNNAPAPLLGRCKRIEQSLRDVRGAKDGDILAKTAIAPPIVNAVSKGQPPGNGQRTTSQKPCRQPDL